MKSKTRTLETSLPRRFGNVLSSSINKHFVPPGLSRIAAMFVFVSVIGCQTSRIEPAALAPEDMCSYCKMAISEKQYASELIDSEGQAFKFDDIGCMANFMKSERNNAKPVAYFVMDFDQREWIKAENAYYVRSSELHTPMNGGIVAFKTESKAQEAAGKLPGKLLRFKDVFNP